MFSISYKILLLNFIIDYGLEDSEDLVSGVVFVDYGLGDLLFYLKDLIKNCLDSSTVTMLLISDSSLVMRLIFSSVIKPKNLWNFTFIFSIKWLKIGASSSDMAAFLKDLRKFKALVKEFPRIYLSITS